jgi:ribosomal protein L37AE/L43A
MNLEAVPREYTHQNGTLVTAVRWFGKNLGDILSLLELADDYAKRDHKGDLYLYTSTRPEVKELVPRGAWLVIASDSTASVVLNRDFKKTFRLVRSKRPLRKPVSKKPETSFKAGIIGEVAAQFVDRNSGKIVDAIYWDGSNRENVADFLDAQFECFAAETVVYSPAQEPDKRKSIRPGRWIIRKHDGVITTTDSAAFSYNYTLWEPPVEQAKLPIEQAEIPEAIQQFGAAIYETWHTAMAHAKHQKPRPVPWQDLPEVTRLVWCAVAVTAKEVVKAQEPKSEEIETDNAWPYVRLYHMWREAMRKANASKNYTQPPWRELPVEYKKAWTWLAKQASRIYLSQEPQPQAERSPLNLDHDQSRAIHRVARALHDGECPRCHQLYDSVDTRIDRDLWQCPGCKFEISGEEMAAVFKEFGSFMDQNLAIFEQWRANR